MKRITPNYRAAYVVVWGLRYSRPCLMNWALDLARRMRARGHAVTVSRFRNP